MLIYSSVDASISGSLISQIFLIVLLIARAYVTIFKGKVGVVICLLVYGVVYVGAHITQNFLEWGVACLIALFVDYCLFHGAHEKKDWAQSLPKNFWLFNPSQTVFLIHFGAFYV